MIYRIYGQKDTTIYEQTTRKNQNSGNDSILETTKFFDELSNTDLIGNSRILTQFDLTPLSSSISSGDISGNIKFYLNLTSTQETEVQREYTLDIHQISGSWSEGMGSFYDNPVTTEGCSWVSRNDSTWVTSSFAADVTGSYTLNEGGGNWYTASVSNTLVSQSFNKYTVDLNVDVTDYVNDWLSGSRPNNGFIIKRPKSQEIGSVKYGSSKFFSNDTNTIYVPTLGVRWVSGTFNTGSLEELTDDNIIVYAKNTLTEYKESSKAKLRVVGRARYPQRTFADSHPYTTIKYLPQTTYYKVKDVETNLSIIPYDTTYTTVDCDSTGNYFDFWFNTLQPERFYQFEFRVDRSGKSEYFDGPIFKVVR